MFQVKEKQDTAERERVKYLLLFYGFRKRRKLERPLYLVQTITSFINDTLKLQVKLENLIIYVSGHLIHLRT